MPLCIFRCGGGPTSHEEKKRSEVESVPVVIIGNCSFCSGLSLLRLGGCDVVTLSAAQREHTPETNPMACSEGAHLYPFPQNVAWRSLDNPECHSQCMSRGQGTAATPEPAATTYREDITDSTGMLQ